MKPKIFIGSSTKGLIVAEAIQKELSYEAEAKIWSQGTFRTPNVPIEDLMNALKEFDFAVFVLLPEDPLNIRERETLAVRDNVLFELGMFLGKLGRQRNFFVTPRKKGEPKPELHLPSDLSGITPATYEPSGDPRSSIGPALYELKQSIRDLGPLGKHETILYDSRRDFKAHHFEHKNGRFYKDDKATSPKSDGSLEFLPGGELRVDRRNVEGRYEIELRRNGPEKPSFPKEHEPIHRVFRVSCEAKVDNGKHELRFVLKDMKAGKWTASEKKDISSTEWTAVEFYLKALSTVDLLFRIDDERPSCAPSSVYLRNLVIAEET
jgi:hypothetical protein